MSGTKRLINCCKALKFVVGEIAPYATCKCKEIPNTRYETSGHENASVASAELFTGGIPKVSVNIDLFLYKCGSSDRWLVTF